MALLRIRKSDTKLTIRLQEEEPEVPEIIVKAIAYLFSDKGIAKNEIQISANWQWGKSPRIAAFVKVDGRRWTRKDFVKAGVLLHVEMLKQFVKDSMQH